MMNLNQYIEHTLLKQDATKTELLKLFEDAKQYNFKGVCINSSNIMLAKNSLKNTPIKIVTVVGFPLGACLTEVKAFEAQRAIEIGADEIDMVMNVQSLKDKDYTFTQLDIEKVKHACNDKILKVIIETDLLTKDEIKKACEIIALAGADFAKTSTGFVKNGVGAKVEDIKLMHEILIGTNVKIKASGGIKTREKAIELINAGAERLGTSSGVMLCEQPL